LRWLHIGIHSFWYDEALSALIARLSISQIVANAAASDHPPGYYLLLHFWLELGKTEAFIRSLSALFSLGSIPLVYRLGRWLFDRSTAALAAIGMAVLPFQVYFAQEARMYGVVIFLAVALIWLFLHIVIENRKWMTWLGYVLVATLGLYFHYYMAFLLLGLHLWFALNLRQYRAVLWRILLADGLIILLFLPQLNQALARTTAYLGGVAWQTSPSILSPLTTIYYLLFSHRTPIWLYPISLFLSLTILILAWWEGRRRPRSQQQLEMALWLSLLTPIVVVIIISWLIQPIYLERSFAVISPALTLLLARGITAAPFRSPTPYLAVLLAISIVITLVVHLMTPDPAKPPLKETAQVVVTNFKPGDVSLHLQDASFMPVVWYAPEISHILIDVPGSASTIESTHQLFGGDVVGWQTAIKDADRLWLMVMPGYNNSEQEAVFETIDATYPRLMTKDWGEIQLYLYDLRGTD
jgi:uncharacterized membrane protein